MIEQSAVFGFPSFWDETYQTHQDVFRAIDRLTGIADQITLAALGSSDELKQVLCALTQVSSTAMRDVIILAGNRRGTGAMKVARSMFEVALTAEYLEKHPRDVNDYLDFSTIRSYEWERRHSELSAEQATQLEAEFRSVKSRFTNAKGQLRKTWTTKSIKDIADELGRSDLYEIMYAAASDIHHVNVVGLISHEFDWLIESLRVAHGSLLQTVTSLYNVCQFPDFAKKVKDALAEFDELYRRYEQKPSA